MIMMYFWRSLDRYKGCTDVRLLDFFLILDTFKIDKSGPQTDRKTAVILSILSNIIGALPMNRSVYHHALAVLVVSAAFRLYEGW